MTQHPAPVNLPAPRDTRYGRMLAKPFEHPSPLPASSEVVVIGGGINGAAIAYNLAKRGVAVTLCEKAEIGCEASSRAFGWVTELMLDPVFQPLTQLSKTLWRALDDEIGETGYRTTGLVSLADTEADLRAFRDWLDRAAGTIHPDNRMMSSDDVAAYLPTLSTRHAGGLYSPTDGSAEPVLATTAIMDAACRHGARIVPDCAVRGIDVESGRVVGVFTEQGYVRTPTVICAANAWTRLLLGNHGIDIPQIYIMMSMGRTCASDGPPGGGGTRNWAWRKQIDGCYSLGGMIGMYAPLTRDLLKLSKLFKPLMAVSPGGKLSVGRDAWNDLRFKRRWDPRKTSPFETHRVLAGKVDGKAPLLSLSRNLLGFPEMASATVAETWSGPLTVSPDNKPILGAVDAIAGLHVVTATGYGITWAPAVGQVMAELITGEPTSVDLAPFRLSRFTDGSPLDIAH